VRRSNVKPQEGKYIGTYLVPRYIGEKVEEKAGKIIFETKPSFELRGRI
jgi:hypothetical protein